MKALLIGSVCAVILTASPWQAKSQLQGAIAGHRFVPDVAQLRVLENATAKENGKVVDQAQVIHLRFQVGDDFIPKEDILVILQLDPRQKLAGFRLDQPGYKFGTDEYRGFHFRKKTTQVGRGVIGVHSSRGKHVGVYSDEIDIQLRFDSVANGIVTGHIDLRLPVKEKTFLQGTFRAKVQ